MSNGNDNRAYFATDGNWGSAQDIVIVDVTNDEVEALYEMSDDERYQWASEKQYSLIMLDDPSSTL